MLALFLLGYVADHALHGHRLAGSTPLVQTHLQFLQVAIGGLVAQRRTVNRLTFQRAAQQRRRVGTAVRGESLLKELTLRLRLRATYEAPLPRRVYVEETPGQVQGSDHLA